MQKIRYDGQLSRLVLLEYTGTCQSQAHALIKYNGQCKQIVMETSPPH